MDAATRKRIAKLHPLVRAEVTQIVEEANRRLTGRAKVRISQGLRTYAEQQALYDQGRTEPGKIVTNAKPGYSMHNFGLAFDIVLIVDGKKAIWDTRTDFDDDKKADWMEVVEVAKQFGWLWGGDFRSFKDYPHFETRRYGYTAMMRAVAKDAEGYPVVKPLS